MGVVELRKSSKEVKLSKEDRMILEKIINTGTRSVKQIKRARILLELDTSNGIEPEKVGVSRQTIQVVKTEFFASEKLQDVLERKKRETPPNQPKITGDVEAKILALACSAVPEGYSTWTLRLLAEKIIELQILDNISHMSVSRLLKKHSLSLT